MDNKYIEIFNNNNSVQINDSFRNWMVSGDVNRVDDVVVRYYGSDPRMIIGSYIRKNGFYGGNTTNKFFFYYNGNVYCTKLKTASSSVGSKYGIQVFSENGDTIFDSNNLYIDVVDYLHIENMLELESSKVYTYQFPVMILAPVEIYRNTINSLHREGIPFINAYNVVGSGQTEAFYPEFTADGAGFSIKKMRFKYHAFFEYLMEFNEHTGIAKYIEPWQNEHLSEFMKDNIRNLKSYSTRTPKDLYLIVAKIPQTLINTIQKYHVNSLET